MPSVVECPERSPPEPLVSCRSHNFTKFGKTFATGLVTGRSKRRREDRTRIVDRTNLVANVGGHDGASDGSEPSSEDGMKLGHSHVGQEWLDHQGSIALSRQKVCVYGTDMCVVGGAST